MGIVFGEKSDKGYQARYEKALRNFILMGYPEDVAKRMAEEEAGWEQQ